MILTYYLIAVFCVSLTLAEIEYKCSDLKREELEQYFSTKTPYRAVANSDDKEVTYPQCKPKRMWSVIRHGSRNPSKKEILRAKEVLTKFQRKIVNNQHTRLCPEEIALMRFWYFNLSPDEEKFLVPEGEDELIELAERMQKRFLSVLNATYDSQNYHFRYTDTQRTLKSAESFCTGLFGRQNLKSIMYPKPLQKDPVLRFYKLCKRWKSEVDKNPDSLREVEDFISGPEVKEVIKFIKKQTHLKDLKAKDVHLMYKICAFETAWSKYKRVSPWCSLFNRNALRVMEFAEDLEYYWIDGYGFDLTHQQACPAIRDMFEHIDPNSKSPNATFYFTHSGTILKLLAHLGLYKDNFALTHADFNRPRHWKTSAIDAFASNIAFVLFECEDEPKVLVMHQERPVRIPGCPKDENLCSLATMRNIFKNSIERCNFNQMCDVTDE